MPLALESGWGSVFQHSNAKESVDHVLLACGTMILGAALTSSLRSATWKGVAMVETARATVERRTAKNCMVQGSIEVKEGGD